MAQRQHRCWPMFGIQALIVNTGDPALPDAYLFGGDDEFLVGVGETLLSLEQFMEVLTVANPPDPRVAYATPMLTWTGFNIGRPTGRATFTLSGLSCQPPPGANTEAALATTNQEPPTPRRPPQMRSRGSWQSGQQRPAALGPRSPCQLARQPWHRASGWFAVSRRVLDTRARLAKHPVGWGAPTVWQVSPGTGHRAGSLCGGGSSALASRSSSRLTFGTRAGWLISPGARASRVSSGRL